MIILIGDYSGVHYELSIALKEKGKTVVLISEGDGYKKIKSDIVFPGFKRHRSVLLNKIINLWRLTGLFGIFNYFKFRKIVKNFNNIEIVQIINPVAIESLGALGNILLMRLMRKKTKIFSMCAVGDDFSWVKACLRGDYNYSSFDRLVYFDNLHKYLFSLKYIFSPFYVVLDFYSRKKVDLIIPGIDDYKIAYQGNKKITECINFPVSRKNFSFPSKTSYPINIFHAWQKGKELRKGNDILDGCVKRYIEEHGGENIIYETVSNVSYEEFVKKYKDSDIVLDQIYSYGCGVTAHLGMAAGKVVFSGFEYGDFEIGINATPDEDMLYEKFCKLIDSPELIDKIKLNAYNFALENFPSDIIANKYINLWKNSRTKCNT